MKFKMDLFVKNYVINVYERDDARKTGKKAYMSGCFYFFFKYVKFVSAFLYKCEYLNCLLILQVNNYYL